MFELAYQLTPADIAQHQKRTVQRLSIRSAAPWYASAAVRIGVVFLLSAALTVAVAAGFDWAGYTSFDPPSAYFGFVIGVIFVFLATWQRAYSIRASAFEPDGPTFSRQAGVVDSDGLRFSSDRFQTAFSWAAIKDVTDYGDAITLWIDPGHGLVVPARAFKDAAQQAAFAAFVREHVGSKSRGFTPAPPPKV